MDSNEYQKLAARTLIDAPEQPLTKAEAEMFKTIFQLHDRLGTLTEKMKKNIFHRHEDYQWDAFKSDLANLIKDLDVICAVDKPQSGTDATGLDNQSVMVLWNVIGLLGESSELAGLQLFPWMDVRDWAKELGDVAWYHAAIATKLELSLGDIQEANIEKLKKRFPNGFTAEDSLKRVDIEQFEMTAEQQKAWGLPES